MNISLEALTLACNRCGHTWLRRIVTTPEQCPACKSKYWNRERVRETPEVCRTKTRNAGKGPVQTGAGRGHGKGGRPLRKNTKGRTIRKGAAGKGAR